MTEPITVAGKTYYLIKYVDGYNTIHSQKERFASDDDAIDWARDYAKAFIDNGVCDRCEVQLYKQVGSHTWGP